MDSTQSDNSSVIPEEIEFVFEEENNDFEAVTAKFLKLKVDGFYLKVIPAIQIKQITYSDFLILLCIASDATQRTYRIYSTAKMVAKSYNLTQSKFSIAIKRLTNAGFLTRGSDSKGMKYFVVDPEIVTAWKNPKYYAAAKKEINKNLKEMQEYALNKENHSMPFE